MKLKEQLKLLGKSYDEGIELGRKGINQYSNLPDYIINNPNYQIYIAAETNEMISDSGRKEIREFLTPRLNTNFVDLGCCLNLIYNGYDQWPSTYYGVDISPKTIKLLEDYVSKEEIHVGKLHCGSIHETPFESNFFEYGCCIGVLEYFERDFVKKAIVEANRILKPHSKFIVDIPNLDSQICQVVMDIEDYIGRPDRFNITAKEFECMIKDYFDIEKITNLGHGAMTQYFLRCKKE